MKAAGEQLLAGAGLTEKEDRRVGVGHLTDSLQRLAKGGAPPDDLAEVPSLAELGLQINVLGLESLTETLVLRQGGTEGALGVPAGKGAGDYLADQPEAGHQVRRPAPLARDRREEEDADDTILDHHRRERARRGAVEREGRSIAGGLGRQVVNPRESDELPRME